jgi:hypothetical protein
VVIELLIKRVERAAEIREVQHPAAVGFDRTAHAHFNAKRVPVETPALVLFRHIRQQVSRLDSENLKYFHEVLV